MLRAMDSWYSTRAHRRPTKVPLLVFSLLSVGVLGLFAVYADDHLPVVGTAICLAPFGAVVALASTPIQVRRRWWAAGALLVGVCLYAAAHVVTPEYPSQSEQRLLKDELSLVFGIQAAHRWRTGTSGEFGVEYASRVMQEREAAWWPLGFASIACRAAFVAIPVALVIVFSRGPGPRRRPSGAALDA